MKHVIEVGENVSYQLGTRGPFCTLCGAFDPNTDVEDCPGKEPERCTCNAIQAADPRRHFQGCAMRKPIEWPIKLKVTDSVQCAAELVDAELAKHLGAARDSYEHGFCAGLLYALRRIDGPHVCELCGRYDKRHGQQALLPRSTTPELPFWVCAACITKYQEPAS
jgi:hypothetical protein